MVARGRVAPMHDAGTRSGRAIAGAAQPVPDRARGRRLALVREATAAVSPKSQGIRHARTGHSRPHEALLDLIDTALDHTPPWATPYARAQWAALLDEMKAHVGRRTVAGRAEHDYARLDDE